MGRSSLRLEVVDLPGRADRLAWLATWLPQLEGSGIVYTLTKRDAELVAEWLTAHGISAEAYSGEVETNQRVETEERLLANDLKAVVATSALGMGYDKPDLGFVVHYQAPGSVISYYQQVGRAGRAVAHADVVLLRGQEDKRIQDFFIEQAFPPREVVERVLEALGDEGATLPAILAHVNLGRGRIEAMLKVLDVEGAVERHGTKWVRRAGTDWAYDAERYAEVTALRRSEQAAMAKFGADGRCLMRALQEELDDPDPQDCGRCAVCVGPRFAEPPAAELVRAANLHLRSKPLVLEVKKMAPDEDGSMRKLADEVRAEEGRALARLGDGGWDPVVRAGRQSGRFDDELVGAAAEVVRTWLGSTPRAAWVCAVPSDRSGALVPDFARRLAEALTLPYADALTRTGERPPQREMANSAQQVANVRGAFAVSDPLPDGPCLLVDDLRFSGWTLAMLAGQLRRHGVPAVYRWRLLPRSSDRCATPASRRRSARAPRRRRHARRRPAACRAACGAGCRPRSRPRTPGSARAGRPARDRSAPRTPPAFPRRARRRGSPSAAAARRRAPGPGGWRACRSETTRGRRRGPSGRGARGAVPSRRRRRGPRPR